MPATLPKTIRRSRSAFVSAITAPPVTSGLLLDLDSREFVDLGFSTSDPISTWTDQSGNGNNATGAGSTRPLFNAGALPYVTFDGVDDFLTLMSEITDAQLSIFAVVAGIGLTLTAVVGRATDGGAHMNTRRSSGGIAQDCIWSSNNNEGQSHVNAALSGIGNVWIGAEFIDGGFAYVQNTSTAETGLGVPDGGRINIIGGAFGETAYLGSISKLLVYDRTLTAPEVALLNTYFNAEFGAGT